MTNVTMCPEHRGQTYTRCSACRSEALASGDRNDLIAWAAREQTDECNRRFPPRYVNAVADHSDVVEWVQRWHCDPADCPSLLIVGPVGVGKTWQGFGALRAAVTGPQTTTWMATSSSDLYASVRPRPGVDSEALMEKYRTVGLLLVDDLGTAKNSEWVEEITYRVIGGRYDAMRPTIYTTNVPITRPKGSQAPILRDALGDRIMSRLAETCQRVVMEGADRRRPVRAA